MTSRTDRPLSRARAWTCLLTNLFATPGLGSLMARRVFAGTGQLLLALAGFVLIVGWIFELCRRCFSPATRRAGPAGFIRLDGKVGTNLFWRKLAVVAGHEFEFVASGESGRSRLNPNPFRRGWRICPANRRNFRDGNRNQKGALCIKSSEWTASNTAR